ncbi:MAG: hypothetical protein AABX13_01470 [Nanoarchaeota archaeon]
MNIYTTQAGTVPFTAIEQAISFSFLHDLPFVPYLARRGEHLLEQRCKEERAPWCLEAFIQEVNIRKPERISVHYLGPAAQVRLLRSSPEKAVGGCREFISCLQEKASGPEIYFFLDEPGLSDPSSLEVALVERTLQDLPVIGGVQVWGNANGKINWEKWLSLGAEILGVYNVYNDIREASSYSRRKRICWQLMRGRKVVDLRDDDLIASSGLGGVTMTYEDCLVRWQQLQEVKSCHR